MQFAEEWHKLIVRLQTEVCCLAGGEIGSQIKLKTGLVESEYISIMKEELWLLHRDHTKGA